MALTWSFKQDHIGYYIDKSHDWRYELYTGNALAIATAEGDDKYIVVWFILDQQHGKRCFTNGMLGKDIPEFHLYKTSNKTHLAKAVRLAKLLAENHITCIWEDEDNATRQE